jgi:hypothetical protein
MLCLRGLEVYWNTADSRGSRPGANLIVLKFKKKFGRQSTFCSEMSLYIMRIVADVCLASNMKVILSPQCSGLRKLDT